MRKFLMSLTVPQILKIASDQGKIFRDTNYIAAIEFISEQAKTYRWSIDDIKSRYGL